MGRFTVRTSRLCEVEVEITLESTDIMEAMEKAMLMPWEAWTPVRCLPPSVDGKSPDQQVPPRQVRGRPRAA